MSDTHKAQIELLQLACIHDQASAALRSYEATAKDKLGQRHAQLREMLGDLLAVEQRRAKEVNLDVLSRWLPDPADLTDKLQLVSSIYHETIALTNDDSEFNRTLLKFQDWTLSAEERLDAGGVQSIEQLPEQWRHAHASTALSVRSLQRQLSQLPVPEQSSLADLIKACSALLDATLRELDMMTRLEISLLEMERARIDSAVIASGCQQQMIPLPEVSVLSWQVIG